MMDEIHFNSHPHIEDDPNSTAQLKDWLDFNSHPHIEDDCMTEKMLLT